MMRPYDEDPHIAKLYKSHTSVNRWDKLLPVPPAFFPNVPSLDISSRVVPLFNDMEKRRPDENDDRPQIKL